MPRPRNMKAAAARMLPAPGWWLDPDVRQAQEAAQVKHDAAVAALPVLAVGQLVRWDGRFDPVKNGFITKLLPGARAMVRFGSATIPCRRSWLTPLVAMSGDAV
jgi:hypothetical protein